MQIDDEILKEKKHLHFIGIGGSGMFPIAQILHHEGYYITGSDNNETDTLKLVRELGIEVFMGQRAENIKGADLIIYTAAIMADNEELIAAKASGVPTVERSIMLGVITRRYKNTLCVCGTHGKTTTTSMLTQILLDGGFDPTAVIGGKLPSIGGNGRAGKSDIMVCEACEYVDTFLKLSPATAIVLNVDEDHMEYFKTKERLIHSFSVFCSMATKRIIANGDDESVMKAIEGLDKPKLLFGFSDKNDYYPDNIEVCEGIHTKFDLFCHQKKLGSLDIYVPGRHNVINAVAAAVAALDNGASFEQVKTGLANFKGSGRRFEVLAVKNGITVVDDYAHHPAEIEAVLTAAKSMNFKRIIAVHQPFTFSRTKTHLHYFAKVLKLADIVVLTEIMGSREKNTYDIYSADLAAEIEGARWFDSFDKVAEYTASVAQKGDLIITLGCGDVYKVARRIIDLI